MFARAVPLLLILLGPLTVAAQTPAEEPVPLRGISPVALRVPAVGTAVEFDRLRYERADLDGTMIAVEKPGSWLSLLVDLELDSQARVQSAWASDPELHRIEGQRLISATDAFLNPIELRKFRQASERAVRESTFRFVVPLEPGASGPQRAQIRFYWRIGSGGTVDLVTLGPRFRRFEAVLLDDSRSVPSIVLLLGPTRDYEVLISETPTDDEKLDSRGIPHELLQEPAIGCGLWKEFPSQLQSAPRDQAVLDPDTRVSPEFPEQARIYRVGGNLEFDLVIGPDGAPEGAVVRSAVPGFPSFVRASMEALCRERYFPASQEGRPVRSIVRRTVDFEIRAPTLEQIRELRSSGVDRR